MTERTSTHQESPHVQQTRVARAAIPYPDHSLLLVRRSDLCENHQGQWELPGGKFNSEKDQSIDETAIREVEEETGLNIAIVEHIATEASSLYIVTFMLAKVIGKSARVKISDEHDDYTMLPPQTALDVLELTPQTATFLGKYVTHRLSA